MGEAGRGQERAEGLKGAMGRECGSGASWNQATNTGQAAWEAAEGHSECEHMGPHHLPLELQGFQVDEGKDGCGGRRDKSGRWA